MRVQYAMRRAQHRLAQARQDEDSIEIEYLEGLVQRYRDALRHIDATGRLPDGPTINEVP